AMRGLEAVADRNPEAESLAKRDLLLAAELLAERHALEHLHHDERGSIRFLDEIGDVHDVLVTDARDRSRLLKETRHAIPFGGEFGAQDFQRHPAAELDVLAQIDLPHAALAQNREHAVAAQGTAQQRLIAIVDDDTWGRMRDRPRQPLRPRAPAALVSRLNGPRDRWRRW